MRRADGSLIYDTRIDNEQFEKDLKKLNSMAKTGFGAVAAAGGAALVKIGKDAVVAFADYEQLVGGVETLFKESSLGVVKNAEIAYKTAGLSANKYMETVTSFSASLLQSVEGDTKRAVALADQAVIDMSDNANKMGTDIQRIQDAYRGFAKQNFTMLDNLSLGFGGTKTEMERLLKEAEKLTGRKYDISSFADITEAIHAIQVEMGIAGTTAREAATTIQGSWGALAGSWENLMVGMADPTQDLDKLVGNVAESAEIFLDNLLPRIGDVADSIGELVPPLGFVIDNIGELGIAAGGAYASFRLLTNTGTIVPALSGMVASFQMASTKVGLFRLETNLAAASSSVLAKNLTAQQLVVGIATGQLERNAAATALAEKAQLKLNVAMAKHPLAITLAAVVALTAGMVALHRKATETSRAINDLEKSHREAIKSIDDNIASQIAEAQNADALKNKLYELEDQIHSGSLTEQEAVEVKNQHNAVASQLNEMIPGIIDNIGNETNGYITQRSEVTSLTESFINLAKAKALANAYMNKMTETQESIIEINAILEPYESGQKNKYNTKNIISGPGTAYSKYETKIDKEYEKALKQKDKLEKELKDYTDGYAVASDEILKNTKTAGNGFVEMGGAVSKAAKGTRSNLESEQELYLRNLKHSYDTGEISAEEYYTKLEEYRDKYFDQGSKEWQKYTEEIYDYQQEMLEKEKKAIQNMYNGISDYATKKLDTVLDKQKSFSEKLAGFVSTVNKNTVQIGDDTFTYYSMHDIKKDIEDMKAYYDGLEALSERIGSLGIDSSVSDAYMDTLLQMDGRELTGFLKSMRNISDDELRAYLSEYGRGIDLSGKYSAEYYEQDMDKAWDESIQNMKTELEKCGYEIPEGFFRSGSISAEKFGEAFISELDAQLENVRSKVLDFNRSLALSVSPQISAGSGNTYSPTYNIHASSEGSIRDSLLTVRRFENLEKLRGGY